MRSRFVSQALRVLENEGVVLDSNQTAFLEKELVQIRAKELEVQRPNLLARSFIPTATDIDPTADDYVYKVWTHTGKAKVAANEAADAPLIEVSSFERAGKVYPITAAYQWGIDELAKAAKLGIPLQGRKMRAALREINESIDEMLAFGHTTQPGESNLVTRGLLNNADVTGQADARVLQFGAWTENSDPDDILADLAKPIKAIVQDTKQGFTRFTFILPLDKYTIANTLKVGVDNHTTVLKAFLENNSQYVESVRPWFRCESLGANTNGRAVVYAMDSEVLEGVVPLEYTELPPQARNYTFLVNCRAKCGGVKIYRPDAVRYADFASA